jgi:hypothetical protein
MIAPPSIRAWLAGGGAWFVTSSCSIWVTVGTAGVAGSAAACGGSALGPCSACPGGGESACGDEGDACADGLSGGDADGGGDTGPCEKVNGGESVIATEAALEDGGRPGAGVGIAIAAELGGGATTWMSKAPLLTVTTGGEAGPGIPFGRPGIEDPPPLPLPGLPGGPLPPALPGSGMFPLPGLPGGPLP